MLIQGSENVTEAQLLMYLWNAKQDDECTELELKDIEFEPGFVTAFIDSLPSKKKWDTIKFTNCHGGSIVNDIIWAICTATSTPITSFQLHQTTSSVDALTFAAISYGLKYAKHWRHLSLAVQTIDYEAGNSLARSLASNTWLESLDLGRSVFSAAALGPISFGLRINRTLHKLVLDGCGLADDQICTILQALQEHPELKSLSIQQNSCHDLGMGAIAALLHYNDLEELDMSYLIRKKKDPLAQQQKQTPEEEKTTAEDETADSKENEADSEGGKEESKDDADDNNEDEKSKPDNDDQNKEDTDKEEEEDDSQKVRNLSLKSFQIAGNFLTDGFLESLLGIFGKGSGLEELNLFGNRISDNGLRMILRKIPHLRNLKTIWLGHNLFSAAAAKDLLQLMKSNYVLQDVNVRSFDDADMDQVQTQIDHYCRLNRGGRRIFAKDKATMPLALWPLVMERAHTIRWGAETSNTSSAGVHYHAADVLYCLVHGPAVFENPNIIGV